MSVQMVNGSVLIPHMADWDTAPTWERKWQTGISNSLRGQEDRMALRAKPLVSLRFDLTPYDTPERNEMEDRIRSAKALGYAVCPFWGWGTTLAAPASGSTVTISPSQWTWSIGDYVFFKDIAPENYNSFEVRTVANIAGATFTLDQALATTYQSFMWPLLFGKLTCDDFSSLDGSHSSVSIQIDQLQ